MAGLLGMAVGTSVRRIGSQTVGLGGEIQYLPDQPTGCLEAVGKLIRYFADKDVDRILVSFEGESMFSTSESDPTTEILMENKGVSTYFSYITLTT